jgi:hypothetical protein
MQTSYTFSRDGESVRVTIHVECHAGLRSFEDIAAILEPDSSNPVLQLNAPLGFNGVQMMMAAWMRARPAINTN